MLAFYIVSAEVVKAKKPFTGSEFVKKYCVSMAQAFGEEKFNNDLKKSHFQNRLSLEELKKYVTMFPVN